MAGQQVGIMSEGIKEKEMEKRAKLVWMGYPKNWLYDYWMNNGIAVKILNYDPMHLYRTLPPIPEKEDREQSENGSTGS